MHFFSQAAWSVATSLACLGTVVDAAGVLDVDLVFPRNETYAPTDLMPIVFAFQNAELAQHLRPSISYRTRNGTDLLAPTNQSFFTHDLSSTNWSSHEPYFVYAFDSFKSEGYFQLFWTVDWLSCDEPDPEDPSPEPRFLANSTNRFIYFTIKNDGQAPDLVAATANDKTCNEELGVAINVTDQTKEVTPRPPNSAGGTCAVLASPSPTVSPNPCQVKIDSAVAASISASLIANRCNNSIDPSADCPQDNTAQRLAVASLACLAATLGAFGYLLA